MAIANVNSTNGKDDSGSSSTTIAATGINHAAGNLIAVGVCWFHTTATASVGDTAGNTYIGKSVIGNGGSDEQLQIFYAYNVLGNASNVVTATFSASCQYRYLLVEQYSGILGTSDPFDVQATGFDSIAGTSGVSGSFTTTQADELIFAVCASPNCGAMTAGSGYTLRQQPGTSSVGNEDKIVSSIQTGVTTGMSWANSTSRWKIAVATFKGGASGGGGGTPPTNLFFRRRR